MKSLFLSLLVGMASFASAQTKLVLQPGSEGKDAIIFSRIDQVDINRGTSPDFHAMTWTWDADGLGQGTLRSLLQFDISALPAGANIQAAKLTLFADNYQSAGINGHSNLTHSNASTFRRILTDWDENTVTWNNQPTTSSTDFTSLPQSSSSTQNYVLDVTSDLRDMAANPSKNHGWMLKLNAEAPYAGLFFASSDAASSALHPKLEITYTFGASNPTFPDTAFFNALLSQGVDRNADGKIDAAEAALVDTLRLANLGIQNLQGIELFTHLLYLDCSKNALSTLDVQHNTQLHYLLCDHNQLGHLKLYGNEGPKFLYQLDCSHNLLGSLEVRKNIYLEKLNCSANKLTQLNLHDLTKLVLLSCYSNGISTLDLRSNLLLEYVSCNENQMTSLLLGNNTLLEKLYSHDNQIKNLDLSHLVSLKSFDASQNPYEVLDISKNDALLQFDGRNTHVPFIYINQGQESNTSSWKKDAESEWQLLTESTVVSIPDTAFFQALIDAGVDKNHDGLIQAAEAALVTELILLEKGISDLTGIAYFTSLTTLDCSQNSIDSLDVSRNIHLQYLNCSSTAITSLDVTKDTALVQLDCSNNASLSSLDVSHNTQLTTLYFYGSPIEALDLSHNPFMEDLVGAYSALKTLDLHNCTALKSAYLDNILLDSLDLTPNTALVYLSINYSSLKKLNLGNSPDLANVYCYGNAQLTSLTLGNHSNGLGQLILFGNKLSTLDLGALSINTLVLSGNQLTSLDVSHDETLQQLLCDGNPLLSQVCVSQAQIDAGLTSMWAKDSTTQFVVCTPLTREAEDAWAKEENSTLRLFPNPVKGTLFVASTFTVSYITIQTLQGQELLRSQESQINVATLPAGTYLVNIFTEQGEEKRKIVIE